MDNFNTPSRADTRELLNGSLVEYIAATFSGVVITQLDPATNDLAGQLFPSVLQPDTLSKRLAGRGISPVTVRTFGITPNGAGWYYPTPHGGQRWKNSDSHAPNKYQWVSNKPTGENFYHAPDFLQAVQTAGGVCWYVSGEADTWAMHSAGIQHVFSSYSEAAIPENLIDFLQAAGVLVLYIAPDLDETGRAWAGKIAGSLAGSGIELVAYELPKELGKGGDLGKLWAGYSSPLPFERHLLRLDPLKISPIREKKIAPNQTAAACDLVPLAYKQAIEALLYPGGVEYKPSGNATKNAPCPFHEDIHPSLTLHKEIGGYCHTCGRGFSWQELGQRVNVGTVRAWLNNASHTLSTQTRERLLQLAHRTKNKPAKDPHAVTLARLLDTLYLVARWEPGREFTLENALEACEGVLSYKTLRTVLNGIFRPFCPTIQALKEKGDKKGEKSKGRPAQVFRLLSPAEVGQLVGIQPDTPQHYDPLSLEALTSAKTYRIAVYAVFPGRQPGQYSRKRLAKRVGISARRTRAYDDPGGLIVTPQTNRELLSSRDLETLPTERSKAGGIWLETDLTYTHVDEKTGEIITEARRFPFTLAGMERAREAGAQVFYKTKQGANHYTRGDK